MAERRSQEPEAQRAELARRPAHDPSVQASAEHIPASVQRAADGASPPAAADLPTLQRLAGNRAVGHLVGGTSPKADAPSNDTGLPDGLKAGVESLSGVALDDVDVRYNSSEPEQVGAAAFTKGREIHLRPGQERQLPHEAWHVVQQAEGRVAATTQTAEGVPVNDAPQLEHEADVMGARAQNGPVSASARDAKTTPGESAGHGTEAAVVQRVTVSVDNYRELMGTRTGNFTLGEATKTQANKIGADWVGKPTIGYATVSDDGLRQFRKGMGKKKTGRTQANVEARAAPSGQFTTNGHITIVAAAG
jgi:uncharacterized protein DUF4157